MRYIEMAPSKLHKNGEKSTITIEYKHKKREKKPFKQEKSPVYRIFATLGNIRYYHTHLLTLSL